MINSCHDFLKIKKRPAFIMACIMILSLAMIWASPNIASARGSKTWPKGIDNQQPQKNAMPYFWGEAIRDNGLTPDDVKVNLSNKATIDDALREGQKDYMKRGDLYYSSFNKFQLQSASQWGTVGYLTSNYQGYSMMPYIPPEITRAQKGGRVYHFFDYPGDTDHGGDDDFSFVFRVNFDNTIKQAAQKKGNLKANLVIEALDTKGDHAHAELFTYKPNDGSYNQLAYLDHTENGKWKQWNSGWIDLPINTKTLGK